jgi:hypothetical protein
MKRKKGRNKKTKRRRTERMAWKGRIKEGSEK